MKNGSLLTIALLFIFTNSIFATLRSWDGGAGTNAWEHAANWSGDVVPGPGDEARIIDGSSVVLSSNRTILGLQLNNSSSLTISTGFTLTTTGNNDSNTDGVRIRNGCTLTINGTLNVSDCGGDGIDVDNTDSALTIGEDGVLTITDAGDNALEITGAFSNSGDITITSPVDNGILVSSGQTGSLINNTGDNITITGAGTNAISISSSSKTFTNDGTVTLSDATTSLIVGSGDFINSGTFKGDGTLLNGQDFMAQNGSTIAPGTSTGILTFNDNGNFDFSAGVTFDMEINGATTPGTDYDQIKANNDVDISNSTLSLSGSHTPASGDGYKLIDLSAGFSITGTFNGIPEGGTTTLNGETLYISYVGGDGNDVTAAFDSPLPVELIDFNARSMSNEVKLSWTTANEINNDYFTIERSADGRTFEAIAMINGNGNSTEISKYTHMDKNPKRGMNYYRLKQTDFDGQYSYSDLKTVKFGSDATIKVYPTAVAEELTIETGDDLGDDLTIVIRDLAGRDYQSFVIPNKSNKVQLLLNDLTPGNYFVVIYNNHTLVKTQKIIKL